MVKFVGGQLQCFVEPEQIKANQQVYSQQQAQSQQQQMQMQSEMNLNPSDERSRAGNQLELHDEQQQQNPAAGGHQDGTSMENLEDDGF